VSHISYRILFASKPSPSPPTSFVRVSFGLVANREIIRSPEPASGREDKELRVLRRRLVPSKSNSQSSPNLALPRLSNLAQQLETLLRGDAFVLGMAWPGLCDQGDQSYLVDLYSHSVQRRTEITKIYFMHGATRQLSKFLVEVPSGPGTTDGKIVKVEEGCIGEINR
jgi:hypothetical protein